jgi:DNA-binding transcriptional MerR regulator
MAEQRPKSDLAFRTIGELADDLGVPQHILRYWETRFPQLKPLQRAGNRRYYRPDDVTLARRIHALLNKDGYTIRGVQQLLAKGDVARSTAAPMPAAASAPVAAAPPMPVRTGGISAEQLRAVRDSLVDALAETAAS